MKRVLFICTHNSVRSQIAEGLLNYYGRGKFIAKSAGTVATRVHPLAIKVMREIGIDISHHRSKSVDEFKDELFDIVVTVCSDAEKNCPFFKGAKKYIHKSFNDPSKLPEHMQLEGFRKIRDEIKEWIFKTFLGDGEVIEDISLKLK